MSGLPQREEVQRHTEPCDEGSGEGPKQRRATGRRQASGSSDGANDPRERGAHEDDDPENMGSLVAAERIKLFAEEHGRGLSPKLNGTRRFRGQAGDGCVREVQRVFVGSDNPTCFEGGGAHPTVGEERRFPVAEALSRRTEREEAIVGDVNVWGGGRVPACGTARMLDGAVGIARLEGRR